MEQTKRDDIGPRIRYMSHYIKGEMAKRVVDISNGELTHIQGRILHIIRYHNLNGKNIYQKDLEKYLEVSKSTMSEMLSSLEKKDYIVRCPDENDQRLNKITLTKKGNDVEKTISMAIFAFEDELKNRLTKEELKTFYELVDKLIESKEE